MKRWTMSEHDNEQTVKFKINGREVTAAQGSTILEAADVAGIHIPRLCHDPRLKPFGACRLCLVEIEGRGGKLLTACSTPVEPNVSVITTNERIEKARRTVLELLAVHHPIDCPLCDAAGECDFQNLTADLRKLGKRRFDGEARKEVRDRRNPLIERNLARCVGCGKCVRICAEVQGTAAIDFQFRGFDTAIGSPFGDPLDCDFCGQCVDICPVGALQNRQYKFTTRSWLLEKHVTVCSYCGDGCVFEVGVGSRATIVRARSIEEKGLNEGNLCQRGRFGHDVLLASGRLKDPMVRRDGELSPVEWREAVDHAARKLKTVMAAHGEGAVAFMIGGRIDNEALHALSRLGAGAAGRHPVASSSMRRMGAWIRTAREAWGAPPPPAGAQRPLSSDLILVLESEINASNPLTWINVHQAKARRGATLVVADSRRTKAGRRASRFLRVGPGGAAELLLRVASSIVREGLIDAKQAAGIEGFKRFAETAAAARPILTSEIPEADVAWLAAALVRSRDPLLVFTLDASESTKSEQLVKAAVNLAILLGRGPECILVPMPESNMRGLVDSGLVSGAETEDAAVLMGRILDGKVKALWVVGDDPVSHLRAAADVRKALLGLDLLVVQDIMLSPTAAMADVVLPAAAWSEHDGCYTSAFGLVQAFAKVVAPPGRALPDWEIVVRVADAIDRPLDCRVQGEIRAALMQRWYPGRSVMIPGTSVYSGLEAEALESDRPRPLKFFDVGLAFLLPKPSGREFLLVTGPMRGHSGVLSTYSAALTSVFPEPRAVLNREDASEMGLGDGDGVNIRSERGDVSIRVKLDDEIKRGVIFVPAHFSEPPVLDLLTAEAFRMGTPVKVQLTPFSIKDVRKAAGSRPQP
jgi:NADH-quinone oxidoreductase subunit G